MRPKKILSLYGLKWNPFAKELPIEALIETEEFSYFCWRVEDIVMDGGFALITGDSGMGKSVFLRLLHKRLSAIRDLAIVDITRPQSKLLDFYKELVISFGVDVKSSGTWGTFKNLRNKWQEHIKSTLFRPIILIDEAQEMRPEVLSELRLISSAKFDSQSIVTVILCGDARLTEMFGLSSLVPLGTRIRTRLDLEPLSKEKLSKLLEASMDLAGNSSLMNKELIKTLAEHSLGNPRVLMQMANELLAVAVKKEIPQLDEKLFFDTYNKNKR